MTPGAPVRIGVVLPRTGRLAALADPLTFCGHRLAGAISVAAGGGRTVELVWRDSGSDPVTAAGVTRELAADPRVVLVVTMAGTRLVPAVAGAGQAAGIPCLSTALPWQVYREAVPDTDPEQPRTFHFCWGLGDIGRVFADLWGRVRPTPRVGCLWNDDRQGAALRGADPTGFLAAAEAVGFPVYDPGPYREGTPDFGVLVERLRAAGATAVTSAAIPTDLARFRRQAAAAGWHPVLITCSRWLAYPSDVHPGGTRPAPDAAPDVATLVYWTPRHPYRSSLDGSTPRELADDYQRHTGRRWLQPLGLAHALLEVAAHALGTCDDPADRAAVARALQRARRDTLAGHLDWTAGPAPGIAGVHLVGGQWRDEHGAPRLTVVTNTGLPGLPLGHHLQWATHSR